MEIFRKLGILDRIPPAVARRFELGASGRIAETPKRDDPVFRGIESFIIGSNAQACTAAAQAARRLGYHTLVLTSRLEGDTGQAARFHMSVAAEIVSQRRPVRRPACIISGGETTVKVSGKGKRRPQPGVRPALCPAAGGLARPLSCRQPRNGRNRRPHRCGGGGRGELNSGAFYGIWGRFSGRVSRRQRLLYVLQPPRRSHRHRSDAYECHGPAPAAYWAIAPPVWRSGQTVNPMGAGCVQGNPNR